MHRRLFTFVSFVSLVLCVATCVLWVRSYRVNDQVLFARHGGPLWRLFTHDGGWMVSGPPGGRTPSSRAG